MNKRRIKNELIKRYKYIYENALYILSPYFCENVIDKDDIYLKSIPVLLLNNIESFLLSDIPMEDSAFYHQLESNKVDKEYLLRVEDGIKLLDKYNARKIPLFKAKLDMGTILSMTKNYIGNQTGDLLNKNNKLKALNEYYKIYNYRNVRNYLNGASMNFTYINNKLKPFKHSKDTGLSEGEFIDYLSNPYNYNENNFSILTEKEKQYIYLMYHDELAWDLELNCKMEENVNQLTRPRETKPCGNSFYIKQEDIFVDMRDKEYKYYHLCPHCGYIVRVPDVLLSENIKKNIQNRCKEDLYIFKKMYLYSELVCLDNLASKGQKKLLKK